ncbi:hypothetical protein PG996_007676 [Apiospora saccharicola]|uniref:NACHT domain-containing protein n=1 Tax=Apiospora saccharicola TaxID=335842 RepID=A0ABR1VBH2_9PEZI
MARRIRRLFTFRRVKRLKSNTVAPGTSELVRTPASDIDSETATQPRPERPLGASGATAIGLEELTVGVTSPKVDVVFVHGLRGDKIGTWSKGNLCWPRDLLKTDLQEARVLSYGWDADIANFTSQTSQDSLYGHADTFYKRLQSLREDKTHPIIFIAHSLGGLLVKQMLIRAKSYQDNNRFESLGSPFPHTIGIIFMGTPHRGSNKTGLASIIAKVAEVSLRQSNTKLLEVLERGSATLEEQRDAFTTISKHLDVVCFREELATGIGLIVPQDSAVYEGWDVMQDAIHANHMNMTKFAGREDEGYKSVLRHIQRQIKKSSDASQESKQALCDIIDQNPETKYVLKALRFNIMDAREEVIDPAFNQTCDWLLALDTEADAPAKRLKSWLSSESQPIFWISGKAGSGKSTLMKFLSKNIQQLDHPFINSSTIFASFYFYNEKDKRFELQMSREGMMRSIIHQCLEQEPAWIRDVLPELFNEGSPYQMDPGAHLGTKVSNWDWLSRAFANLVHAAGRNQRKILLLVDGLDEYRILHRTADYKQKDLDLLYADDNRDEQWGDSKWIRDSHEDLINILEAFQDNTFVKACVSSRELSIFESRFSDYPRICVQDHTANGIVHYCKMNLVQGKTQLPNADTLSNAVVRNAQGVFLWVKLVVGLILQHNEDGDNAHKLMGLVNSLPRRIGGEGGLYWHMIQHIPRDKLQQASTMLYIMAEIEDQPELIQLLCAAQAISTQGSLLTPPSLSELQTLRENVTLVMTTPDYQISQAQPALQRLRRQLQSHCLGLLETKVNGSNHADYWALPRSKMQIVDHPISQIKSCRVSFTHSTVRDFLSQRYAREKLKRGAFNAQLTLLNGALLAFREDSCLVARWFLSTYQRDIFWHFLYDNIEEDHEEGFFSAFENINKIIGVTRKAIADYFSKRDFCLLAPESFWISHDDDHLKREKEGREATVGDIDDLCMAVSIGYHTYLESRLIKLEEQCRSRKATDLLIDCFMPRYRGKDRAIYASPEVVKVLLQHGADLEAMISVAADTCHGQVDTQSERTTLPV